MTLLVVVTTASSNPEGENMAKRARKKSAAKRATRKPWSKDDVKLLREHSRKRTPVPVIAKTFKRTEGAVRQKALQLGIGLGHRR